MNNNNIPYKHFENYILRTPLLPLNFYKSTTNSQEIQKDTFINLLKNPAINESIYLASPEFYNEIEKWINGTLNESQEIKIKHSVLKYISRLSSRCTPFGLFAGCCLGTISKETNIVLKKYDQNLRHTRFDMNFLVALSQNIANLESIKSQLQFSPNKTIYHVGKNIRYIEYFYIKGKRNHQIVSLYNSQYISKTLHFCKDGSLIKDIISEIVSEKIDLDSATEFVNDLIKNQILVSNLEPSVTGIEFYDQIIQILKHLNNTEDLIIALNRIKLLISDLDTIIGNPIIKYKEIIQLVENLGTEFDSKYLFQTDMILNYTNNSLNEKIVEQVKKGISVLNKLNAKSENKNLIEFKKSFLERYEGREISLPNVLDTEIGIGYEQTDNEGDLNPLIDDLNPDDKNKENTQYFTSTYNRFFHQKIMDAYINDDYILKINENELNKIENKWDNLPDTMSTIIELVNIDGQEKIKFSSIGGSSAANLLSRFCHADKNTHQYVKKIVEVEKKINNTKILAEIVHLPESRVGNILMRPNFRDYEIPYLGNSTLDKEFQIQINDLYVSIKNNKIILRSKKHNKEVIPRLTNAHNYSSLSLPIYHFLCDLQTSERTNSINFNLGSISNEYNFIPRIEFENIIFQEATWNISSNDMKNIFKHFENDKNLLNEIKEFQKKRKIPNLVLLVERDNQLLIDLTNLTSLRMFLEIIKPRNDFKIIEFLFNKETKVKNINEEYYTNEIILSFYNDKE
ncbi:lantibiotic dehydratase family protein [Flavobacterium sp. LS1R49]|uniref:Lantibiotic dehydratase family protein n=1 Tax=Flavobacterium shii TaxID=2987687 RepID=A0A9X2ZBF9_9FLAO|nr:lantibiotic dehydratase family protein [Flavobacterium shii]MCV9926527.1 lantibiotic dehydratase family protein [Flavobacterium shii]